jgi:hypothetical protein
LKVPLAIINNQKYDILEISLKDEDYAGPEAAMLDQ